MKKFAIIFAFIFAFALFADEGAGVGIWFDSNKSKIEGVGLGLPVIKNSETEGASLALCGNHIGKMEGFSFALLGFNYAARLEGMQLAFVNIHDGQDGDIALQWGFYNQSARKGVQIGFINNGENDAIFQLGLININKNGLFPVMIFVNFSKDFFD